MFGGMGIYELAVIVGIAIIVFGASRIPGIARSLGEGIREFKKTRKEIVDDVEKSGDVRTDENKG